MVCFPNAKINIGLHVVARRADGFHDLETVFYPIGLTDVLEAVPGADTGISFSGLPVPGDGTDNLVLRAYRLLQQQFPDQLPALSIYLHKAIPMGAGLGGGSADAAFALKLFAELAGISCINEELEEMALSLGSDVPFFIRNTPCFASGRGEQMEPVNLSLKGWWIKLVCPQLHVSTAEAFSLIRPKPAPLDLRQISEIPVSQWRDQISNDFEQAISERHPAIRQICDSLYAEGATYAAMSGSGSACFGLFRSQPAEVYPDAGIEGMVRVLAL